MIVLIGLAGLLALVFGFIFCPFGALFWFLLAKNAEDARESGEVQDTLEEEVERQYTILRHSD